MTALFTRDVAVTVGTLRIAARPEGNEEQVKPTLRMTFKVEKSLNRDPNKADLKIWNLSEKSRKAMQTEEKLPVIIEAGYVGNLQQIFSGNMEFSSSSRQGPDWITELQSGDGSQAYRSARISESFGPGTQLSALLKKAAEGLGVGLGNAVEKFDGGGFRGGLTELTKGASIVGRVSDVLDKFVTTAGFEWSIQDGQLQVLKPDETTSDQAVRLTQESGLIGSPELGEKGRLKARSLLQGNLVPGRSVEVIAEQVDGFFRIQKTTHTGDTWGTPWYSDIEARPV